MDAGAGTLEAEDLVGTWKLLTWQSVASDGSTTEPFGPAPLGYVVYTADSRMITTISAPDRPPIGGDLLAGPETGRLQAFATFLAYSGSFRVERGEVVHRVEMSLFPDWIETDQRRSAALSPDGQTLTLSTRPLAAGGRTGRHVLTWQRVGVLTR